MCLILTLPCVMTWVKITKFDFLTMLASDMQPNTSKNVYVKHNMLLSNRYMNYNKLVKLALQVVTSDHRIATCFCRYCSTRPVPRYRITFLRHLITKHFENALFYPLGYVTTVLLGIT